MGYILSMTGHQKKDLSINTVAMVLSIGLNIVLIQKYGIIGAAVADALCRIGINSARMIAVYRIFKVQPFTAKLLKLLFVWVGMIVLSFILTWQVELASVNLGFAVVAGLVVAATILLLKLEDEDKRLLMKVPVAGRLFAGSDGRKNRGEDVRR